MAEHIWKQFFHKNLPGHGDRNRCFTTLSHYMKPCGKFNTSQQATETCWLTALSSPNKEDRKKGRAHACQQRLKIAMGVKQCTQETRPFICLTPSAQTDIQQTPKLVPVTNNVKFSPNSLSNYMGFHFYLAQTTSRKAVCLKREQDCAGTGNKKCLPNKLTGFGEQNTIGVGRRDDE